MKKYFILAAPAIILSLAFTQQITCKRPQASPAPSKTQISLWCVPNNQVVPTLYYQGIFASQTQCAKYTGDHGFASTTGEQVVCTKSIEVIHTPYIGMEIDEVRPQVPFSTLWSNRSNPLSLLEASYYYTHYLAFQIQNKCNGITVIPKNPNRPSTQTIAGHSINVSQMNIGQSGDVKNHQRKYHKLAADHGDCPVIIYGVSRGAVTSFNALALNKYANVRLAILEGCFDSHEHLFQERFPTLAAIDAHNIFVPFLETFTSYKKDGINPIDQVAAYPKNVPTLFITSKIDASVPAACTRKLAHALAKNGHKEVYLLELKNSSHPGYTMDDKRDKESYEQVTHALYQKLQLPHRPALAQKGKKALEACHL